MAISILKKTPIHVVVAITGANASETIDLETTLETTTQNAATPKANISGIYWSIPSGNGTVSRNSVQLWAMTGARDFQFHGFSDNRENGSNIVVTLPAGGGTIILEIMKVSGYGDTQHVNPLT